jgi:hypothetical protein
MSLPDIIASECPGATVQTFPDTNSILIKFRNRSILLCASTIELGEAAVRGRLRSLIPRSGKPTRVRKPKQSILVAENGDKYNEEIN